MHTVLIIAATIVGWRVFWRAIFTLLRMSKSTHQTLITTWENVLEKEALAFEHAHHAKPKLKQSVGGPIDSAASGRLIKQAPYGSRF